MKQVATQAELEQILSDCGDSLVVIDFSATWCSPCQKIAPEFEQLSRELSDVVFLKVDVDENEVRCRQEKIRKMAVLRICIWLLLLRKEHAPGCH